MKWFFMWFFLILSTVIHALQHLPTRIKKENVGIACNMYEYILRHWKYSTYSKWKITSIHNKYTIYTAPIHFYSFFFSSIGGKFNFWQFSRHHKWSSSSYNWQKVFVFAKARNKQNERKIWRKCDMNIMKYLRNSTNLRFQAFNCNIWLCDVCVYKSITNNTTRYSYECDMNLVEKKKFFFSFNFDTKTHFNQCP